MNNKQEMYQNYMMNNNNIPKDNKNFIFGPSSKGQMRTNPNQITKSNPMPNTHPSNTIPFMDNTNVNNRYYPEMMRPNGFQPIENIPFQNGESNDTYYAHSGGFPGSMSIGSNKINMNNINNMNINIINQTYQRGHNNYETDELINSFQNLNVRRNDHTPAGEKSLYNYYFGDNQAYNQFNNDYDQSEVNPMTRSYMNQSTPHKKVNLGSQLKGTRMNINSVVGNMNIPQKSNDRFPVEHHDTRGYSFFDEPEYEEQLSQPMSSMNSTKGNVHIQQYDKYFKDNSKTDINKGQNVYGLNSFTPSNLPIGRFFVIKSVDEDNIHKSIKYRIWCSTIKGNQKLQQAYKDADGQYPIYLFFSVNGSGRFLGLAQMTSEVEYRANFNYWSQNEKWKGFFFLVWVIIKDIPNRVFRNIINELNENKPVTSSRDTQEIHPAAGAQMLKIFNEYPYESSILDDFSFYERRQEIIAKPKSYDRDEHVTSNDYKKIPEMNLNIPMPVQKTNHFDMNSKKILKRVNSTDHILKENVQDK